MSDIPQSRPAPSTADYVEDGPPAATGWAGWVVFAGVMLILVASFQVIQGLVALFDKGYYLVGPRGLIVNVSYNVWGWTHLVLGVIAGLTGLGLLAGNMLARVVGVIIAMLSAFVNLAFIAAAPVWSSIIIAVDVFAIYAIIVHGRELKSPPY
jgi:hypothetical protein